MAFTPTTPLPPVRYGLAAIEYSPGLVQIYDEMGYTERAYQLTVKELELLDRLDGQTNALAIAQIASLEGIAFSIDEFLELVENLDKDLFLDSARFRAWWTEGMNAFNALTVRPAMFAGSSYPANPAELRSYFDGLLAGDNSNSTETAAPIAVVSPHIDFRVGGKSYAPAYNALRRSQADTFIVIGVSHKMSYDDFMISRKDFDTPLGVMPTDREFIDHFRAGLPFEITDNEIAHQSEHSIEFQAVFLRHIFADRDVKIVPILPGSFYEYCESREKEASEDERLTALYEGIERTAKALGRTICYIAAADMSHVGTKFGDPYTAHEILPEVRVVDAEALACAEAVDAEGFLKRLASEANRFHVCGVAPIYATIRAARPSRGELLCYDTWDETERDSAVTFASMAFY
jgi:AmmeMemoRadiSam system protein B